MMRWMGWLGVGTISVAQGAIAQTVPSNIVPDGTLGADQSTPVPAVINGLPSDRIDGGATRGINLFHSFERFNVDAGQRVYFANPAGIENILSRVTGNSRSDIFGTLGVLGNANLFLMNPNGIVFGPNASLDVGGSFVATTANAIGFGDLGNFSATNRSAPSELLTINPSVFLFNQINPKTIVNNARQATGFNSPSGIPVSGLRVPDGKSLLLVGGDIDMDGGRLNALGGRIELGGLAAPGSVGLRLEGNNLSLDFTSNNAFSNITLANDARVSTRGSGGGDIVVNTNVLTATKGGRFVAGIDGAGIGGNIDIKANEINLSGIGQSGNGSGIYNDIIARASGSHGDINIQAGSLSLANGALLSAQTYGKGSPEKTGNINLDIRGAVILDGTGEDLDNDNRTEIVTAVRGEGKGGNIIIKAGSLTMRGENAVIDPMTYGKGNAGNVSIQVDGAVSLDAARLYSSVSLDAIGNGGNVKIKADSLSLTNGAFISVATYNRGNAGNVYLDIQNAVTLSNAFIESSVASWTDNDGNARQAKGNSGEIQIYGQSLSLINGGRVLAITKGQGNAGRIFVKANAVTAEGKTPDGQDRSGFFTETYRTHLTSLRRSSKFRRGCKPLQH